MGEFKPLKELVKALTYIGDAIEGEESKGDSVIKDDTNYLTQNDNIYGLVNRNLDSSKLAFHVEGVAGGQLVPTKVGDIFTQEGVDIINSMLSNELIKTHEVGICVFFKDTSAGNLLIPLVTLGFNNNVNKYAIRYQKISGFTSDKFTLDTPMSQGGIA